MFQSNAVKVTVLLLVVTGLAILSGCSKKTDSVTSNEESSTQSAIENIINQNPELFSVDQAETEEATAYASAAPGGQAPSGQYISAYEVSVPTATLPVAWFRKKTGAPPRNINIDEQGNFATVTITTNWTGKLYIDRTNDGIRNPGTKPIADTGVKKAYFERIYGIWTLRKISCVDHNLTDISKQSVDIVQVEAKAAGKDYVITDPGNLMDIATELPTFSPGTVVTVIASVVNTNPQWAPPVFVYLHHGILWGLSRQIMYDDGTHGDEAAGDGKYTGVYTIGAGEVYRHAAIDVLDSNTLQNETNDDYNSTVWRIPFKVQ